MHLVNRLENKPYVPAIREVCCEKEMIGTEECAGAHQIRGIALNGSIAEEEA